MAKWIPLPQEPIIYQPDQIEFLNARRSRICFTCEVQFSVVPEAPNPNCPNCGQRGKRLFDRISIIAGRQFGKTKFGALSIVEEALIPGSVVWACAPTYPKLHRYILPAIQKLVPIEWVEDWNTEHGDLRLKNKSLIHLQTLEHPDQGRGQTLDALWIDEVCELTKGHWDVIRPSLGVKQGVAFFTTSPRSFDWVYDDLHVPALRGTPGYWSLKTKSSASPKFQTPEGQAFLERERALMSPEMYAQEYEGDFVTFTGAVYKNFDHLLLHTEDQIREFIPSWPDLTGYQILVGMDTGADHPFGAVKLVSTEKGLIVIGEYLERDRSFVEHATELHALASGHGGHVSWACNKNERQGMIELAQHGIYPKAAANDQMAGVERVRTWLHQQKLFFYAPLVPKTIRQMKAHRFDENVASDDQKRKERLYKKDDELPDCVRYALMVWPRLKTPVQVKKERDLSHFDPETRSTIEFIRRVDSKPTEPTSSSDFADFWGN